MSQGVGLASCLPKTAWPPTLTDDAEIKKILGFLREREVVHYQRFGEALMHVQDNVKPGKLYCK